MRCLAKNQKTINYKVFVSKTQVTDDDGYKTGEYQNTYGDLVTTKMSLSQSGQAIQEAFGISERYNLVAMTDNLSCAMDVDSIVWVNAATTGTHDFIVRRKIVGLDHITYGLTEVKVNA